MADLVFVVRTPREVVFEGPVRSARVPAPTGQVGLRPSGEPMMLAVEPGLVVIGAAEGQRYAATAGGLLEAGRERATLFTPFAVVDARAEAVLEALDAALATPNSELSARRRLGELEQRIVQELRHRPAPGARRGHG